MSEILTRVGVQSSFSAGITPEDVIASLGLFLSVDASVEDRNREHCNLLKFQSSAASWKISHQILEKPQLYPHEACNFAAQTLRIKTEQDSNQISKEQLIQLRESLIGLLRIYSDKRAIVNHISLSLSNMALLIIDWKNPIKHILDMYGGIPEMIGTVLEFLTIICGELNYTNRTDLCPEQICARNSEILTGSADLVYDFMVSCLGYKEHVHPLLECLSIWIETGDLQVSKLIGGAVMKSLLEFLCDNTLIDASSDCLSKLFVRSYGSEEHDASNIASLHSTLWTIRDILMSNTDSHSLVCLSRIYASAGESWMLLLVERYPEYADLFQMMLEFTSSDDQELVKSTFTFWYCLNRELSAQEVPPDAKSVFFPVIKLLARIMEGHLRFPPNYDSITIEDRDDFLDFRHEISYILEDCARMIGSEEALSVPLQSLQESIVEVDTSQDYSIMSIIADPRWPKAEAAMYCIRAMGNGIDFKNIPIVSNIMSIIMNTPNQPTLRRSLITLLGSYAEWTASHPEFIPYNLHFIEEGFRSKETASVSAFTLKSICKLCSPNISSYIDQLHILYSGNIGTLHSSAKEDLVEAAAYAISSLQFEKIPAYFKMFITPIIGNIGFLSKSALAKDPKESARGFKGIELQFRLLSILFKHVNSKHICPCIVELWPVLLSAAKSFTVKESVAEPVASVISSIVRYYKEAFIHIESDVIKCIYERFASGKHGCWMYTTKWVVHEYNSRKDPQSIQIALDLVLKMSFVFLEMFSCRQNDLDEMRCEIEDFFIMSCEALKCMPIEYSASPEFHSIFACALQCLFVTSRSSLSAVLKFFKIFLKPPFDWKFPEKDQNHHTPGAEEYIKSVISVLNQPSPPLLQPSGAVDCTFVEGFMFTLFKNLLTIYPRDRETIRHISGLIIAISSLLSSHITYLTVEKLLLGLMPVTASESIKKELLLDFKHAIDGEDYLSLEASLHNFESTFRQKYKQTW